MKTELENVRARLTYERFANDVQNSNIDWVNDDIRVTFLNDSFDTSFVTSYDDVARFEVTDEIHPQGGVLLTGKYAETNGGPWSTVRLKADNIDHIPDGSRYLVVYIESVGLILSFVDFGETVKVGENVKNGRVEWSENGVLKFSPARLYPYPVVKSRV